MTAPVADADKLKDGPLEPHFYNLRNSVKSDMKKKFNPVEKKLSDCAFFMNKGH